MSFKIQTTDMVEVRTSDGELIGYVRGKTHTEAIERATAFVAALEKVDIAESVMKALIGQDTIEAAVRHEREACALLAEKYGVNRFPGHMQIKMPSVRERYTGECTASNGIAMLIRSRGE